jgi:restriction endonuclease S subunit
MTDRWQERSLGDLFEDVRERLDPRIGEEQRYVGLEHFDSGRPRLSRWGRSSEVQSLKTPFVLGDTLFGKLRPYLKKAALADFNGCCSTDVLVLRPKEEIVVPAFLTLLMSSAAVVDHAVRTSAGTRMPRTSLASLRQFRCAVPPLDEQRRIVHLVDAVDSAIESSAALGSQARRLLEVHLDSLNSRSSRPLGACAEIGSGPSWKSEDEHSQPVEGGQPVIGITNTRPGGRLDLAERRYVVGLSNKIRTLGLRSLIMIRTNGNRRRIGNIYRVTPDAVGSAVSAFQIAMEPTEEEISDFLYWVLRRPSTQAEISEAASGTTGLGNVAVKWLRELRLPWPEESERLLYVEVAEALLDTQIAAEDQSGELGGVRAALVEQLLSADHAIPDSYDALMESV